MMIGHYGVALALKRAEPKLSLGTLFLAVQLVDVLWGAFVLLGWERVSVSPGFTAVSPFQFVSFPLSHSLAAGVGWGIVAAGLFYSWPTRDTSRHARAALLVGLAVLSHWPLDVIVHVPDLPLAGDASTKVGLALWDSLPATLAAELGVFAVGLALFLTAHRSKRRPFRVGRLAVLFGVLALVTVGAVFGPPPPSGTVAAVGALVMLPGLALLAGWADRG